MGAKLSALTEPLLATLLGPTDIMNPQQTRFRLLSTTNVRVKEMRLPFSRQGVTRVALMCASEIVKRRTKVVPVHQSAHWIDLNSVHLLRHGLYTDAQNPLR